MSRGQPDRPDLRLALAAIATWTVAWLVPLLGARAGAFLSLCIALSGLALLAYAVRRRTGGRSLQTPPVRRPGRGYRAPLVASAALLSMAAVGAASAARVEAVTTGPVADHARERRSAWLELVLTGDAEPVRSRGAFASRPQVRVPARVQRIGDLAVRTPVLILAEPSGWTELAPSTRVRVFGRLGPSQRLDGTAAVVSARGDPVVIGGPNALQRRATELRAGLREAVDGLPAPERGLVPGLTVGDTSTMPAALVEQFRHVGLTHLTAVSGANLAIVVAVVLFAVRWIGLRGWMPPVLALIAMIGFVVLARPQPSVVRAAVMATFAVFALLTGRRRAGLSALCAAVLVLLLLDPWLARSYGFALSVLATGGLLILAPGWRDRLSGWLGRRVRREPGRVIRLLAEAVAIPAAAQAACLPVLVMLAGEISLVAVPANVLAVPAVAPVTVLGLLALILAPISGPAAQLAGHLAGIPAGWIVRVAEACAEFPGAVVPWRSGAAGAVLAVIVVGLAAVAVPHVLRRPALATAAALILAAALARPVLSPGWPPPGWLMVACDVGQGDGLVVRAGRSAAIVVDAGPDPMAMDGCLADLGVRQVPLVVLTHFHADHVLGLPGVIDGRQVGQVIVSPWQNPAETAALVRTWTADAGIPMRAAVAGEVLRVAGTTLHVLGPRAPPRGDDESSAANDASVVLRVEAAGLSMLLTGDIEPEAQADLLASAGSLLRADVYKVPHHGSGSQDPRMLAAVQPDIAIVSVGADNDYGHPAPRTVLALRNAGILLARTDEHGDVAVTVDNGRHRAIARR